jgi:arylsulfatase
LTARGAVGPEIAAELKEPVMTRPFKGKINVDIRDSVPDRSPFEPPKAPEGTPTVVYAVLDDVGFPAMGCYGGPIETPNIDRIAGCGFRSVSPSTSVATPTSTTWSAKPSR